MTLYWFANNLLSTGQTLLLRKITPKPELKLATDLPMPGTPAAAQPVRVEYVPKVGWCCLRVTQVQGVAR